MTPEGERPGAAVRIDSSPFELAEQVGSWGGPGGGAGGHLWLVLAADVLTDAGANGHLAHPLGVKGLATAG
jgi:hypothetical protein